MNAIYGSDTFPDYDQFFRPEFISQRLGTPGTWQGSAMTRLGLTQPVQAGCFKRLLEGLTPDGRGLVRDPLSDNAVRGWQFTLDVPPALDAMWALAPRLVGARIRIAHNRATQTAVADFEQRLSRGRLFNNLLAPDPQRTLFAKFQSGASRDQTPHLGTNLLLFNFVLQHGDTKSTFTQDQASQYEARMQSVYKLALEREIRRTLGALIEIPKALCERFQRRSDYGPLQTDRTSPEGRLKGNQLFAAWREQGRSWGWGPEKVESLLIRAKGQLNGRNVLRGCNTMMRLGSVWIHQRAVAANKAVPQQVQPGIKQPAKARVDQRVKPPRVEHPKPAQEPKQDKEITQSHSH